MGFNSGFKGLIYLFFTFLHISAEVEINSPCHHNKLFTLVAELLVGAFIKQCGLNMYKPTACEDSTLIGIGDVPTAQVLKDRVRLNRWSSPTFYLVYTNFAKIGKLIYIYIYI